MNFEKCTFSILYELIESDFVKHSLRVSKIRSREKTK